MSSTSARVRIVVVNYDGGDMTLRCLDAIDKLDWPPEALEVVVVDNASIDGIAPRIREERPSVRLIEHHRNAGFAGGCNLGLTDLDDVDYVALVNNDAIPAPNWLQPLAAAFDADPTLGAACPKIVFSPPFVALRVEAPTFRPPGDPRDHGVRVSGVAVDGVDVWRDVQLAAGCHAPESRRVGGDSCWTGGTAEVRVPVREDAPAPREVEVELSAEGDKPVRLSIGPDAATVTVTAEPTWFRVPVGEAPFDVINNVGSRLVHGGYGGDRGFLERDAGQYDEPADVFAWCGAAVLMSTRYLRDVGIFDDRYFVYYEDTDLAWRGRLRNWNYRYVPTSVVRHLHAATSGEGSVLFSHYVERNRLLTLARNAPGSMVRGAVRVFLVDTLVTFRNDVLQPLRSRHAPRPTVPLRRARTFAAFVKLLPPTLAVRFRQRRRARTRVALVERWAVPR